MNDDMLALARRFREEIGSRIGWHNVEFRKGRIQDLALDLDEFDHFLRNQPIGTAADWLAAQRHAELLRSQSPMVATESIDVVLSNCVLNLVQPGDRRQLFSEVFRVLRPGGRAVISDIVSSAPVPGHLRGDPELWSGCVSGAFEEPELFTAFEDAGFIGLNVIDRQPAPWMVVEGIVFRSLTLQAMKPAIASGTETHGEVIYRGPWRQVVDDGGTELHRGRRTLVTGDTLARLRGEPYAEQVVIVAAGTNAEPAGELLPVAGENCCGPGKCC
jgi:SAM-dependent methyltransferase